MYIHIIDDTMCIIYIIQDLYYYYTVDARDVAKAEEILLAESKMVQSGERFLLFSGDILYLVP